MPLYVCLRLCAASSRLPLRVCVGGVCLSVRLFVASASSRIYGASCASHFRLGTRSCARTSCPRRWKPPGRSCSQRCVLRCAVAACHVLYHVHRDDTHGVGVRWHGQGARHFQWLRGTSKKTAAAAAANKKKKTGMSMKQQARMDAERKAAADLLAQQSAKEELLRKLEADKFARNNDPNWSAAAAGDKGKGKAMQTFRDKHGEGE